MLILEEINNDDSLIHRAFGVFILIQAGPAEVFGRYAPILRGLGFGMAVSSFLMSVYYNVVMSWAIHYLFSGMKSELPWSNHAQGDRIYNDTIKDAENRTSCCYGEVIAEHRNSTLNSTLGTYSVITVSRTHSEREGPRLCKLSSHKQPGSRIHAT